MTSCQTDPLFSRWMSVDPALGEYLQAGKKEDLPGLGGVFNPVNLDLYHYAGNNPVKYVDPDGRKVLIIFDLSDYKITVIDLDTKKRVKVSAYAFSGNEHANDPDYANDQGKNTGPLPLGDYELLDHPSGKVHGKTWFDLEKKDGVRDDKDSVSGRDKLRLHSGTASDGCITVIDDASETDYHGEPNEFKTETGANMKAWNQIVQMIQNTKTTTVTDSQGRKRIVYGEVKVKE